MNANSRANRAARRVRAARDLMTLIKDNLQEAEAELYIDGAIRHVDEASALTLTGDALAEFEERLIALSMLLSDVNKREGAPEANEFDGLAAIAKEEGIFRDRG